MLPTRALGRTGLSVSAIGLGTTEIGYVYGIGPRDLPDEATVSLKWLWWALLILAIIIAVIVLLWRWIAMYIVRPFLRWLLIGLFKWRQG